MHPLDEDFHRALAFDDYLDDRRERKAAKRGEHDMEEKVTNRKTFKTPTLELLETMQRVGIAFIETPQAVRFYRDHQGEEVTLSTALSVRCGSDELAFNDQIVLKRPVDGFQPENKER